MADTQLPSFARAVGFGLSVGLLLLVAGLGALLIVIPRATGSMPLTVLTSSMEPHLPPGTLLVVRPEATGALRVGEVATYQVASGQSEFVTHRIVAITTTSTGERLFTFQGDANASADEPVRAVQVRGVVWYGVPLLGWANDLVAGPARASVIPGVAGTLLVYAAAMILLGVRSAVRRRRGIPARGRRRAPTRRSTWRPAP